MIHTLSIDIENYSSADLARAGTYRYAESDDFRSIPLQIPDSGLYFSLDDMRIASLGITDRCHTGRS